MQVILFDTFLLQKKGFSKGNPSLLIYLTGPLLEVFWRQYPIATAARIQRAKLFKIIQ